KIDTMKKITLIITTAILISGMVTAQDLSTYNQDTLKNKMKIYTEMLKVADSYLIKAEAELKNVKFFKAQARTYLDSAYILAQKADIDKSNAQLYILQFNYVYDLADKFLIKSDSFMAVVDAYKDTATMKNKEAESYYLQLVDNYQSMLESDTLNPVIYTVQLGAGNMDIDYFNKVTNLEIITPGDGIKRFISGAYRSKSEALEARQKMIDLGYYDAFIRSMESLNY
ncbi:MAG: hypothetical protein V1904_12950, partial [Bacteroidota bacterium]